MWIAVVVMLGLLTGCDLLKGKENGEILSTPKNVKVVVKGEVPDTPVKEVVMCQNVKVERTKERTTQTVVFEGFQHIERSERMGQRNISHCIPCSKATSEREKFVCQGDSK